MTRVLLSLALLSLLGGCGPGAGQFGAACAADAECETGACFTGYQDGYCSQRCEDVACPGGTVCAALGAGSYCLQSCRLSVSCRSGYHCADVSSGSVCFPDCREDAPCGPGARCENLRCVAGSSGPVGAPCSLNVGCATNRCQLEFNGGYCTDTCAHSSEASFDQGCPSGSVCAAVSEAGGLCHATCQGDGQCRADYSCDPSGNVCRPRCRGATNCGVGYTCHKEGGGKCIEGTALPRQLGARCGGDSDCDSDYCLDAPLGYPKGYCSDVCDGKASACGASGLCITNSTPDVCLQKCLTNFDCRLDYFCSDVSGTTARVCFPRCTVTSDPLCNAPEVCDPFSGDCVPPQPPGSTTIERRSLGTYAVSAAPKEYSVEVPSNAVSFTVVLKGRLGGVSAISRLTSPTGELLFDIENYLQSKARILPVNDGDLAMLYPNSPRLPLSPGRYRFSLVNEGGAGSGEVFALIKKAGSQQLFSGRLNINFWFAGVPGIASAAAAQTDPKFQQALSEFRRLYEQAGVTLGEVRYFDVPAAQAASFAVVNTIDGKESELRRLFEISAGASNSGMNMFLVREIEGGGAGLTILGIAGGIPGIPFEQGTNASGVAVTTLDLQDDPLEVARTMAHEGGHWLGLWHTTEQNAAMHDPLSDTPECGLDRNTDGDKIVSKTECAGTGAEQLMFWQAGAGASTVTRNQGYVLLRNPVVTSP